MNNVALTSYGYLKRATELIRADYGQLGWTTECPDNPEEGLPTGQVIDSSIYDIVRRYPLAKLLYELVRHSLTHKR